MLYMKQQQQRLGVANEVVCLTFRSSRALNLTRRWTVFRLHSLGQECSLPYLHIMSARRWEVLITYITYLLYLSYLINTHANNWWEISCHVLWNMFETCFTCRRLTVDACSLRHVPVFVPYFHCVSAITFAHCQPADRKSTFDSHNEILSETSETALVDSQSSQTDKLSLITCLQKYKKVWSPCQFLGV